MSVGPRKTEIPSFDGRRAVKDVRDEPPAQTRSSRKNTKRWCRGKVGREHDTEWFDFVSFGGRTWEMQVCKQCGKHLNWREKAT